VSDKSGVAADARGGLMTSERDLCHAPRLLLLQLLLLQVRASSSSSSRPARSPGLLPVCSPRRP